jgi:hypothetical protein
MKGQLVRSISAYQSGAAIPVTDLPAGVYSVQVIWENGDVQVGQLVRE